MRTLKWCRMKNQPVDVAWISLYRPIHLPLSASVQLLLVLKVNHLNPSQLKILSSWICGSPVTSSNLHRSHVQQYVEITISIFIYIYIIIYVQYMETTNRSGSKLKTTSMISSFKQSTLKSWCIIHNITLWTIPPQSFRGPCKFREARRWPRCEARLSLPMPLRRRPNLSPRGLALEPDFYGVSMCFTP